ncbi:MAG: AAA family ATPase [Anaerolineales bacterium]|nr:AAA family ATPase [Anaerolineales bacterium]
MNTGKPAPPCLTIHLFGCLELRRGDELLPPLATRKTQSLLAYLILYYHQPHARDELAALFWGDRDDIHARHSLATALWRIRRLLGEKYFLADAASVQFNPAPPFWLDVAEFEQHLTMSRVEADEKRAAAHLQQAIELYRNDFLEGFYDDWCLEERYRLETLYLEALSRLIVWSEAQGNAEAALAYAQKYLARDPLMEDIHLAAMRALVALGDLTGARRQWQRCCEMRQQELHAPPSPEMLKRAESILGAYFTIPLPLEPAPARSPPRWDSLERPPFVGRGREMDALWARWEQALQGRGGMVLISGEAGVGKTRLSEEFAAVARWHGGVTARGRCYEPERALPYQPLTEVLRDLIQQERRAALALPAWARGELARLIPELIVPPIQPETSPGSLQPEQQAILFHAIATFVRAYASRTPLLIVLEDLHWATDSTLAAIHYLARQIGDMRVLCLATFRPEEFGETQALTRMAAQLARDGLAQHLALERLSIEAISELVQRTIQAETEFVNRLYVHTEGNAFFSIETLRALAGTPTPISPYITGKGECLPIPGNVRALIEARLRQLSATARQWMAFAAAAGRTFDLDLVCHAMNIREDAALEAIDELLRQGFLCEGSGIAGRDYEFVHHLVQEATYTGIHHRRRRRLHRLIGEAMENLYADQPAVVSALAHHFDAAGEVEKALHYHGLAAQRAEAMFAWQEAEEHQVRMLQWLEQLDPDCTRADCLRRRGRILADRAELRYFQARLAERDADLAALEALVKNSGDESLRLQALMLRARYLNLDAHYEQAIVAAEEGVTLASHLGNSAARSYLLTQIGFAYYFLGQPQPALTALESALAATSETERETRRHITHILGYVHFHLGNFARSIAYQQDAYASHQVFSDYNGMAWAGLDIGAAYLEIGQLDEAGQYITEHLNLARRIGARSAEAYGLIQLGAWELRRGGYVDAANLFLQALSTQQALRTEHGRVAAEVGIGFACYHLGDVAEARRWLEQAIERARPIRHLRRLAEALIGLGLAEITAGELLPAYACLSEAVAMARDSEARGNLAAGLAALARAERRLGDLMLALAHASEAAQIARQINAPACEMWGELEIGLARLSLGDLEAAEEHTRRAVDLTSQGDERWIGIEQVHQAHARVLRELGSIQAAAEQERLAEDIIAAKTARIPDRQQQRRYLESAMRGP